VTAPRDRRSLLRLLLPLLLLALVWTVAAFRIDDGWRHVLHLLGVGTALALALLALVARRSVAMLVACTLAAAGALALLPPGQPLQLAVLSGALGLALARVAADLLGDRANAPRLLDWVVLALVAQVVALQRPALDDPRSALLMLLAVPLVCAGALAAVAAVSPRVAVVLGVGAFAAGAGFGAAACVALAVAAIAVHSPIARWRGLAAATPLFAAAPALVGLRLVAAIVVLVAAALAILARNGRTGVLHMPLAAAALVALLGSALPWGRSDPIGSVAMALLDRPLAPVVEVQPPGGVLLTSQASRLSYGFARTMVHGLSVESSGIELASLPCGTPLARLRLRDGDVTTFAATLRAGSGGGDWAAQRPDLRGHLGCPSSPSLSWFPRGERFLGSTFGTEFRERLPVVADGVELERSPLLPAEAQIHLVRIGIEP